jgi:hypothetical protein
MSRGPGKIERAIETILNRAPAKAFTTEALCKKIYKVKRVERKHRIAVRRAAANVAKRRRLRVQTITATKIYSGEKR